MQIIICLGNPGKKYEKTRHNLGFVIANFLAEKHDLTFKYNKKLDAGITKSKDFILVKPQTFMNLSGQSGIKILKYYKVKPEQIWVIHDEIDLPLGKIRLSKNASSAGHKGIESIIQHLGTKNFFRFRVGVGNEISQMRKIPSEKFVLQNFNKSELKKVKEIINKTAEIIEFSLENGIEKTISQSF